MLKVLLVDDEPFILKGLSAIIDWEAEGFYISGTAENGRQALEFLHTKPVDLIIADIRMPEMGGLELLEAVRKDRLSDARFVLLSGISDFSYAQKAIRLQCTEYILKPVEKDSLLKLLKGIASSIKIEKRQKLENERMEEAFYARSMVALLMGKFDAADAANARKRFGDAQSFQYIGMEAANGPENDRMTEDEKRTFQRKLYRACLDFLGERENCSCIFSVTQRKGCYDVGIIYCGGPRGSKELEDRTFLEQLRDFVTHSMRSQVLFYAGCRVKTLTELSESYRTATVARTCQAFTPDRDIVRYEKEMSGLSAASLDKAVLDALIDAVASNDRDRIKSCVAEFSAQIRRTDLDEDLINLDIDYFLFHLVHLASQQDDNVDQKEVLHYISESVFNHDAWFGSESHFLQFVVEYSEYLASLRNKSARGVLSDIEHELETRFSEDLSLKTLSEKYFVNCAYLGQLFKKKFGVSFKTYLTNLRIEKAAQLLLQTDDKVYRIAKEVGYRDIDYFIDRFVEIKGCTPTKFRRQAYGKEKAQPFIETGETGISAVQKL